MKKLVKVLLITVVVAALAMSFVACSTQDLSATGVKYFVAHQGGYIGEAIVETNKDGSVAKATLNEWLGVSSWAKYTVGTTGYTDKQVVRYRASATDAWEYYFYNAASGNWHPTTETAVKTNKPSGKVERDFEGNMGNPVKAEYYVKSMKAGLIEDVTVASEVITGVTAKSHYVTLNKADKTNTYMVMNKGSIGYRLNLKATVDFFVKNAKADFTTAKLVAKNLGDMKTDYPSTTTTADYVGADTEMVFELAGVSTGATWTDFVHYSLELQAAYNLALANSIKL